MFSSSAQQAKLPADPDVGALYSTLKASGQATLALVPIIALAIFGVSDATKEYELVGARGNLGAYAGMTGAEVTAAFKDAAGLIFLRVHSCFSTGHAWQHTMKGTLKAQRFDAFKAGARPNEGAWSQCRPSHTSMFP